jgi:hypothetical protein
MANIFICEGCDCLCRVISSGEPMQPSNSICLWPERREGPNHKLVKPEWYMMVKATVHKV